MNQLRTGLGTVALILCVFVAAPLAAQEAVEEPAVAEGEAELEKRWSNEGELAWVNTSGNAAATTFAFSDTFTYNWTYSELILHGEYFKATAREEQRFNEGGGVRQVLTTSTTAERLDFGGKFRQNILDQMFWYAMGNYYRNQPSGINSRVFANGGVGYRFMETPNTLLVGELGLGVTRESRVGDDGETFVDARAYMQWKQKVTDTTDFELSAEFMDNLQNTSQLRINSNAAVTTRISSVFALRVTWDLRFNNDPPVLLIDTNPDEPVAPFQLKTSDRTFAASVVFTF
jgi:putative salt-induced outer membrane protein YdiY